MGKIEKQTYAVKLTPNAEKAVKKGHPWVYETGIQKIKDGSKTGDIAIIFNSSTNAFLAIGLIDQDSIVRIKLLSIHKKLKLDTNWIKEGLKTAYHIRKPLLDITNAFRLCYGESDQFPGLIIDVYNKTAVIKLYSLIWIPYLEEVSEAVKEICNLDELILRFSRNMSRINRHATFKEGYHLLGSRDQRFISIYENDVKFLIDPIQGHKTGFFLDHRNNRIKIGKLSKAKRVLDVFCYIGGFSMHALKGGASEVVSMDISQKALKMASQIASENGVQDRHTTVCGDAFKLLNQIVSKKEKFDLIIIDPPSMAKAKDEIEVALNKYTELAKLGAQLLNPGGIILLASCSSRININQLLEANQKGFLHSGEELRLIETADHDIDHPISIKEMSYLKAAYYSKL